MDGIGVPLTAQYQEVLLVIGLDQADGPNNDNIGKMTFAVVKGRTKNYAIRNMSDLICLCIDPHKPVIVSWCDGVVPVVDHHKVLIGAFALFVPQDWVAAVVHIARNIKKSIIFDLMLRVTVAPLDKLDCMAWGLGTILKDHETGQGLVLDHEAISGSKKAPILFLAREARQVAYKILFK